MSIYQEKEKVPRQIQNFFNNIINFKSKLRYSWALCYCTVVLLCLGSMFVILPIELINHNFAISFSKAHNRQKGR